MHRNIGDEAPLKSFLPPHEKPLKPAGRRITMRVQRSMGIIMVTVLAIAVLIEIGILVAEIATRARLVARSLSSSRARA